jgi:alkylated DNA repair protein alkB family protein 4
MRHDARREEKQKTLTQRASAGKDRLRLPGHFVIEDFVTVAEETALVKFLDDEKRSGARWKLSGFNGKHLGKKWGVEVDLKRRTVKTEGVRPMPPELLKVAARLRAIAASELDTSSDTKSSDDVEKVRKKGYKKMPRAVASAVAGFAPNEANAIDYRRLSGMELRPHCDDRQMSSGVLVNLSLLGDCVMTYARDAKRKQKATRTSLPDVLSREDENETRLEETAVDVFLPRRSLQLQTGETRYDFSHAIRNENLLADRRVSVTFRESAPPAARRKAH